jgi:hypothetical protein
MTVHRGIASKGFTRGLRYLRNYRSAFQNMQAADHLFVVRVAYFLDRVFQDFINDLGNNRVAGDLPGSIAAAKSELEREQTNLIHAILGQIKVGVAPPIQLPASLLSSNIGMDIEPPASPRTPTDKTKPKLKTKDKEDKDKETRVWRSLTNYLLSKKNGSSQTGRPTASISTKRNFPRMCKVGPSSNITSRHAAMHPYACVTKAQDCANGGASLPT